MFSLQNYHFIPLKDFFYGGCVLGWIDFPLFCNLQICPLLVPHKINCKMLKYLYFQFVKVILFITYLIFL